MTKHKRCPSSETDGTKNFYKNKNGIVFNDDVLNVLPKMANDNIKSVIIDPPFGINYSSDSNHNNIIANDDNRIVLIMLDFFDLLKQKLTKNAGIFIFGHWKSFTVFENICARSGFKIKNVIVWDKMNGGRTLFNRNFAPTHEFIYYIEVGKNIFNSKYEKDVMSFKRVNQNGKQHQNQKPLELLEKIIKLSSVENDVVFDGFAGSGSTLIAAQNCGRQFIGSEINKDYFEIIKNRLKPKNGVKK